ncbi:TRAP transporter small permease [Stappia sp.]|jgi:TRAP-type C4-dicarboxylate transport system permease small subunit|uniref:TRAP transporter small permease n=1 Tax=Stappia sp. TaxID=1870903 RepID=UPI003A996020
MSHNSPNNDRAGVAKAAPVSPLGPLGVIAGLVFRVTALVGMACLFGAGLVTVVDIVMRAFESGIHGAVDIVQLLIMATAFTAIPYAFFSDGHVSVDIVTQSFPDPVQKLLRALTALASAVVMALILYYGWEAAKLQMMFGDKSQNIGIPLIWYWMPLIVGAGLSVLACLFVALEAALAFRFSSGARR